MDPIVKYYEDEDDIMPRLRPLILPQAIATQFSKILDKKWKKALTDRGHVRPANEFLDAFLETPSGRVVLFYVADLMHKLGLSVSYEFFRQESGFDLFQVSLRHQMEEQSQFIARPGYDETEPQIIYKLSDFVNGQSFYNKNPELCYDRDVVNEIWDDLHLWPAVECNRRPTRRSHSGFENVLLNLPISRSALTKRRAQERGRNDQVQGLRKC